MQKGDKVYIHYTGYSTTELAKQLIREVYQAGGVPFPHFTDPRVQREMLLHCTREQVELMARVDREEMEAMACYIGVRGADNITELSDVPAENMAVYDKYYNTPVHHEVRVAKTRWVAGSYTHLEVYKRQEEVLSMDTVAALVKKMGSQGYAALDNRNRENSENYQRAEKFLAGQEKKEDAAVSIYRIHDDGRCV